MGESPGTRSTSRAALRQLAGPWRVFLFAGLGWLLISVVVLRFALASVATATVLVDAVVLLCASGGSRIAPARSGLPVRRRLAGYALAVVLAPLLTLLLAILRDRLDLTTDVLVFLVTVIAVALLGGIVPAVLEAIAGSLLLSAYFTSPTDRFTIAGAANAAALGVLVVVALVVSLLVDDAARRAGQAARATAECELLASAAASIARGQEALAAVLDGAREAFGMESVTLLERGHSANDAIGGRAVGWTPVAVFGGPPLGRPGDAVVQVPATDSLCLALRGRTLAAADRRSLGAFAALAAAALKQQRLAAAAAAARPIAEADRMRTALLAAVSHDLRTPLAAAKAAISGLRSPDIQLTAADHDELLATADESLDLLTRLAASLLDMSRLQAGALPVFPRPADLQEIITRSLHDLGPQARAVTVEVPPGLPSAMTDPPIMERVIANVTANALRYSPGQSPPLLTVRHRGDRVELRVADRGPGVPQADRDRMFVPFERLGDTGSTTGIGLGLAVSRGLTEAMRGTLEPEQTPGGGLTMVISLPAAPTPAPPHPGEPGSRKREETGPTRRRAAITTAPEHGRCCSDSGPAADEPQIPRTLPAPAGQGHSDSPGHAARAAGSGADALQTWFRPPGRQTRGRRVTWTREAGA